MALNNDIRWIQRFSNFRKALGQLEKFIVKGNLSDLEEQGLIKAFEYTYELGWKTLKDYLEYQGIDNITGSRDAIREAFGAEIINNGEVWMQMLQSRNLTAHSYNEKTADEIVEAVLNIYFDAFKKLEKKLESLRTGSQDKLF
ncbi:nucleotidyltransferase substrate binding protein [Mucilaginibacter sp.]|uniref:nucleotidyltransferase substrate binding protein n=1 Tax=Mucilaginibacter sp. TaxID=1882438 RepID=UPI000CC04168|nr:nucleotidyltransferase substrate binding protein [Mucilaginibacter sp.]PLW88927.1 MAG: nucleotidyltransferase [Mucilaginibacter sp.]HEK22182.1 nucleotidyltransferase [Bacteroidota bacterium]